MASYLYANATSLFDYSNGASKSLKLLFENLAKNGDSVYVVCGFTSNCRLAFNYNKNIATRLSNIYNVNSENIIRFKLNGVYYSLIKTRHWSRLFLASDEQETIYYEALRIINEYAINATLGWGNLLLEESIFRYSKAHGLRICFYLVNPYYKNKKSYLLDNADIYITDSEATKNLYSKETKSKCIVLPKFIQDPFLKEPYTKYNKYSRNCLFINPSLKKGLEPFLTIAKFFEKENNDIKFIVVDSKNILKQELSKLSLKINNLPTNISIRDPSHKLEKIFNNVGILLLLSLWHESGSRLIYESYCRGVPVLAFNTGGTSEFMKSFKNDIFVSPKVEFTSKNYIKINQWDPLPLIERIKILNSNKRIYEDYSYKIKLTYEELKLSQLATEKLSILSEKVLSL